MEYVVVHGDDLERFERKVNKLLGEGWRPLGGIFVVLQGTGTPYHYQTLVRSDKS